MPLAPGTHIGAYEIRSLIGAGGMGEVYRASDPRLKREVAIKVLPRAFAQDADRMRRFELEAQAAGRLNHPNVLAIYDVGVHEGSPYLVSELLEGETLRDRLRAGKLPPQRALDYARQAAAGLAAAHAAGIVHRDLKPENLFVTKDGRVKILDFGLAKQAGIVAETDETRTSAGTVLGTVPYMSPEQVRGQKADQRSDLFSFGCVLHEMLSGEPPFKGASQADTMSAILSAERPDLSLQSGTSPALDRIVGHCLEKDPDERFQSARDLAFDLASISGTSQSARVPAVAQRGRRWRFAAGVFLALALGAGLVFLGRISVRRSEPSFQRLTFQRGSIVTARFAPDNQTVVYDAAWEGEPPDIFAVRIESPESRVLGFPGATLHGISRSGELALGLKQTTGFAGFAFPGVLARAPFSGGAPRAVAERVTAADWSPDGSQMALVRDMRGNFRLEYPSGTVLYQTAGYIDRARISPSGDHVAFLDHPAISDDAGYVAVVDRSGHYKRLTTTFTSIEGLAWSSKGDEIWFSGAEAGSRADLWAVTLSGRRRLILRQSATVRLHDIGADGRVLIANEELRSTMMFRGPSDNRERELTWLDWSVATDISPDGSMIVFSESGEGAREGETQYLRETSGAPAVKLGRGSVGRFSTDGRFVVSTDNAKEIVIYPTGPGEVRRVRPTGFTVEQAGMLADGRRLWFQGHESASSAGIYVSNLDGTASRLVLPGGASMNPSMTPDGRYLIARVGGDAVLVPVDGDKPRPLPTTIEEGERIACWAPDGRSFLIHRRSESPAKVYRVDVATGRRDFVREIGSADRAGLSPGVGLIMTPDAKSYVYNVQRTLDELYIVNGLK